MPAMPDRPVTGSVTPAGRVPSRRDRLVALWPASRRRRIATVVAIVAIVVATYVASSYLLRLVFGQLDLLAYAGLFAACWIGAGGALVPVPGVRPISWVMVVQQGAALDPIPVALVGAVAMVLGQTSYFVATRRIALRGPTTGGTGPEPVAVVPSDAAPRGGRWSRRVARARSGVEARVRTHGMLTVFAVSSLPSPLTTLTTTAAAASGMPYVRFFPASFAGFLTLCSVLALFGQGLLLAVGGAVGRG